MARSCTKAGSPKRPVGRAPRAVEHSYRGKIFHTGENPWDRDHEHRHDKFIKDERFLDKDKDGRFLDKRDGIKDGGKDFKFVPRDEIPRLRLGMT